MPIRRPRRSHVPRASRSLIPVSRAHPLYKCFHRLILARKERDILGKHRAQGIEVAGVEERSELSSRLYESTSFRITQLRCSAVIPPKMVERFVVGYTEQPGTVRAQ